MNAIYLTYHIENVRKYWMDKRIQLFLGLQDFQVGILGLSPALCKKKGSGGLWSGKCDGFSESIKLKDEESQEGLKV